MAEALRQIVDAFDDDVFWCADASTLRLSFLSHGAARLLDLPVEQLLDQPDAFWERIPADDRSKVHLALQQAATQGQRQRVVHRFVAASGEVWRETAVRPIHAQDGAVRLLAGHMGPWQQEAVRQGARLEAIARTSTALGAARLETAAVAQVTVRCVSECLGGGCHLRLLSEDGEWFESTAIHHASPEVLALLGEILGANPRSPAHYGILGQVLRTRRSVLSPSLSPAEMRAQIPEIYWPHLDRLPQCSLVAVPMLVEDRVIGVLGIGRSIGEPALTVDDQHLIEDLAERAALAMANARLYEDAQHALRLRDEFLSVASHELRTPVTSLQFAVQTSLRSLRAGVQPGASAPLIEMLGTAERQSRRLGKLIDSLLDVSRLQAGKVDLSPQRLDLAELACQVVEQSRREAEAAGCSLTLEADEPVEGTWDGARLEQVVTNLVANALKYGAGGAIEVTVKKQGDGALLSVRDHGIGIAVEQQPRVFDRFERAVSVEHYGGFGLGLFIVRQLVEAHGGVVSVRSTPGAGSTFTVELPCAPPAGAPAGAPP